MILTVTTKGDFEGGNSIRIIVPNNQLRDLVLKLEAWKKLLYDGL